MKTTKVKKIKSNNFVKLEASDIKLIKGGEPTGNAGTPHCPAVKCNPCTPAGINCSNTLEWFKWR